MRQDGTERKWIKACAFLCVITSILTIFSAIYLTPDYFATHLSPDGILHPRTVSVINNARIVWSLLGIVLFIIALISLTNSSLVAAVIEINVIKNRYFEIITGVFFILTLTYSIPSTIETITELQSIIGPADAHTLRMRFHRWYRCQHMIYEFIQKNIPENEPLLVVAHNSYHHFLAYYLAPRPVYFYSDAFATELEKAGHTYHVLTMIGKSGDDLRWSITKPNSK